MLGVDEGRVSAGLLRVGHGVQRDRGLTRGFGTVDLDHTAARQAADAQRHVQGERAGGDHLNRGTIVVTQAHNGALAELLIDLRQGYFERLVAVVRDGLCRGCFTGCHDDPFVRGLSDLRVSWPG